jgi:hypothetical protein
MSNLNIDFSRGFDVFRSRAQGGKLVKQFDSLAEAENYARSHRGCYVRFYAKPAQTRDMRLRTYRVS